jgi:hypothetical protein
MEEITQNRKQKGIKKSKDRLYGRQEQNKT